MERGREEEKKYRWKELEMWELGREERRAIERGGFSGVRRGKDERMNAFLLGRENY